MIRSAPRLFAVVLIAGLVTAAACGKKQPPVARPIPPPPPSTTGDVPPPPEPVREPVLVPPEPSIEESGLASKSLDDLNRASPLQAVFFDYDSSEIAGSAQASLTANADVLRKFPTWVITIEGHCDERGTVEYNLALGERRAVAARNYLVSLGIAADRLKTVSYGEEFPFAPGSGEDAWAKNRRAHFVITAK